MGTRGLIGVRNNKKLLSGRYNHMDSYYNLLGERVIDYYFDKKGIEIINLTENVENKSFLQNGLFCEFAYVYNKDNDTLEVYRGFFKKKQHLNADTKTKIADALEDKDKEECYCHLIMIIDRKKHTQEQVLKAFEEYNKTEINPVENEEIDYPERDIIPLEINKDYIPIV